MSAMTGGPYQFLNVKEFGGDALWNMINEMDGKHYMFNASSNKGTGSNDDSTDSGIVHNHAYTLVSTALVNGTKLFKMRNPWAYERYVGPWSDNDSAWGAVDQATKDQLGYSQNDDGIFFIPMDVFISDFVKIDYLPDVTNMHASRFLMIDDQREYSPLQGQTKFPNNVRHNFSISSEVDQTVFLTVYVHHARSYPSSDDCKVQYPWDLRKHALVVKSQSKQLDFADGQGTIELYISSGETIDFHAEFGWHTVGITKDFGLTAWGSEAPVTLEHEDGLQSYSWNVDEDEVPSLAYEYPPFGETPTSAYLTNWAA